MKRGSKYRIFTNWTIRNLFFINESARAYGDFVGEILWRMDNNPEDKEEIATYVKDSPR